MSIYVLQTFERTFPSWSEALKAAKMITKGLSSGALEQQASERQQLDLFESNSTANNEARESKREAEDLAFNQGVASPPPSYKSKRSE